MFKNHLLGSTETVVFELFQSAIICLIMVRALEYLQVFQDFRSIMGIITKICFRICPFMVIVFLFYSISVLVFVTLNDSVDLESLLTLMYIWLVHGGVDSDAFVFRMNYIPVMFGSILVTIVLMNIMIAYLSNEYSRLELKQHLDDLRNKVKINMKVELMIRSFKVLFVRRFREKECYRHSRYTHMIKDIMGYQLTREELESQVKGVWF